MEMPQACFTVKNQLSYVFTNSDSDGRLCYGVVSYDEKGGCITTWRFFLSSSLELFIDSRYLGFKHPLQLHSLLNLDIFRYYATGEISLRPNSTSKYTIVNGIWTKEV